MKWSPISKRTIQLNSSFFPIFFCHYETLTTYPTRIEINTAFTTNKEFIFSFEFLLALSFFKRVLTFDSI
jgi:hypothetical protein